MLDPITITDDHVLQVMSQIDLDAERLTDFRVVRHYLRHHVPLCCIAFMVKVIHPCDLWLPSLDRADRLTDSRHKLAQNIGYLTLEIDDYLCWSSDALEAAGLPVSYTPCPACILAKRFVFAPPGCPSCQDEAQDKPVG